MIFFVSVHGGFAAKERSPVNCGMICWHGVLVAGMSVAGLHKPCLTTEMQVVSAAAISPA